MANSFRVDTIPTPRIDLFGAFARDLLYYMDNGNTLPPMPRSSLMQEQEKLNKFMLYVNESFIIKGFSKYNPIDEIAVDSDVTTTVNGAQITIGQAAVAFSRFSVKCAFTSHLYAQFSLFGELALPEGESEAELEIVLRVNNEPIKTWKRGMRGLMESAQDSIFLPDRAANTYAIEITAKMSKGSFKVPANAAYGAGYLKLKTVQG